MYLEREEARCFFGTPRVYCHYMKTHIIALVSFLSIPLFLSAHSANLPEPGLTPESRLYFFEQIAESIQEFFTFDAEAKALLHASLAKERIAEIDNMLDEVGVEAKGLSIAEDRLERHLARATEFVSRKADKGENVDDLLNALNTDIDDSKEALKEIFEAKKDEIEARIEAAKKKVKEAKKMGDTDAFTALTQEITDLKIQKEMAEEEKDRGEEVFEKEEKKIERTEEKKSEAEKAIAEAKKKRGEVEREASGRGIALTAENLKQYTQLLAQAE